MSNNYTSFCCQDGDNGFDVFLKVQGNQQQRIPAGLVLLTQLTQSAAQKIKEELIAEKVIVEHTENGETLYVLAEKGKQLAEEAKQRMLEEQEEL